MNSYNPQKIEEKWQKRWEEDKIFKVDVEENKKKYYVISEREKGKTRT